MEEKLFNELVSIRRHLHENPELGFNEFKTSQLIQEELSMLEIPVEKVAVTGLLGTLTKGPGPTVLLRADMDALPVVEETGLSFKSLTDGIMHACGHDIHTTMLLGAARLLKNTEFNGTIKFLFQPAEESPLRSPEKGKSGGQIVAESGKLHSIDAALGLHVHPLLPVGQLGYRLGESYANVGNFVIRINGRGGHPGAMKHVIDPVIVAGHLITEAHSLTASRSLTGATDKDPDPAAVFAITHIETLALPSFNVIPSSILFQGSLRALHISVYNELVEKLKILLKSLEERFHCTIELEFTAYYPSLLNDEKIHRILQPESEKIFGEKNMLESQPYLIGEDFAFYSRMMPAQFYFLGAKTAENSSFFLHHPKVTFNEDCMRYGVPFLTNGALALLKSL